MTTRRPRTAAQSTALPSLAALIASGVAIDGCDDSAASAQRQRRLAEQGQQAARKLDGRRPGEAATHIGVGLGLIGEPTETRIQAPGEAPAVRTDPVPMPMGGAPPPVTAEPPDPRQQDVDGGIRQVDPTPPAPPRTPHQQTTRVRPQGGATAVHPSTRDEFP